MTPFEITVFIHHATAACPFERRAAPIYRPTIDRMVADGLFTRAAEERPEDLAPTPKARALLAMLQSVPMPGVAFTDPRTGERIEA